MGESGVEYQSSGRKWHKPELMLIGEYTHILDSKSRVAVPARFRKELGRKVVITRGLDACLAVYPIKEWSKVAEKISGLSMGQSDTRGFSRFMLSGATETDIDSMGRILIPDFLKEFSGLKTELVFAGGHRKVEIWDRARWKEYQASVVPKADKLAEKLGEVGAI